MAEQPFERKRFTRDKGKGCACCRIQRASLSSIQLMKRRLKPFLRATIPWYISLPIVVQGSMHRGESFGFLGPNGAGKSTVVKILTGLVAPTAGTVRILGQPVSNLEM